MGAGGAVPYVKKVTYFSPTLTGESYILYDGMMRKIREVNQTTPSNYTAQDTVYNNMGQVARSSVAYSFSGVPSIYTGPNSTSNLYTTYTYDTLGRTTLAVNALGNMSSVYDKNKTTTTDQIGKVKSAYTDAFGNLIKIDEYNAGATYTTEYTWNTLNKLTKIKDALGNVRNFTYDGLGRRKSAEDLHDSTDSDYGVYYFSYDNKGNLTQKITPNGSTVNYTYDALDRPLVESLGAVPQITNIYDTCPNGVGMLCSVARVSSSRKTLHILCAGFLIWKIWL